ncbi:molybdate ABC transporter substrate-binding protein [Thermobifida halotolerans]|uniref:Molybdate ABC transporter substrate-binding protein n=1 Tax=Thermobifida halotolerans TaxID=483545 RepID=A0A399FYJ2_9ACTN|nr:molybdate ABC transporter substrate-binding protein [Thermobifida halotolerans]UOE19401.1 molybdate ABC transporter substrate-binding protein [Thermobifida halotolerans]
MRDFRIAAPLCAALAVCACAPVGDGSAEGADRTLTVFAAASLTETFQELAAVFEAERPGVAVEFVFAGSSALAEQLVQGAPADVFASADTATMDRVADEVGVVGGPVVFARNTLRIAVPPDNPAGIDSLSDLADDDVAVALCAEQVPCGAAARTALDAAGVAVEPVTWEEDVKAALTRVRLGEVDAALVYRSDVAAADGAVLGVDFPQADTAVNDYPVAVLADAPEPGAAAAWVDLVTSPEGAKALDDAGFDLP